jgi:hypothetical protein
LIIFVFQWRADAVRALCEKEKKSRKTSLHRENNRNGGFGGSLLMAEYEGMVVQFQIS